MEHAVLGSLLLGALHSPARAAVEAYDCDLARGGDRLSLRFDLDTASFAPPLDPNEPPRRRVSRVTLGDDGFTAEAILSENGQRGFWSPDRGWLLTMDRDGAARLSDADQAPWLGRCKETG
ncbi:hypothetical protein [Antarctobacter sp.]|uniref:hypothetical protein n=1 Tax=Antarctobacter sp. TaxID=1872577 RepID=UPI002B2718F4|nr:hypothetical protein [Antarctobacter sp.]